MYGTPLDFSATGRWRRGELRLLSIALAGHKLMLGLEYQDNYRVEQNVLDLTDTANDPQINSEGYRVGLYVQDEWRFADTLTATLGMRVDRNDATGTKTSSLAALIWQAAPEQDGRSVRLALNDKF